MIASAVSGKIAGALVEEDRVKILAMIQEQVTWLAGSFLLTDMIENLNANLARVIDQNALRSFRRRYTTTGRDQYVNQTTGGQYHQATPRHGI